MDPKDVEIGYKIYVQKNLGNQTCIRAEILDIRQNPYTFYVHYINYNKRLDEWIPLTQLQLSDLSQIEIPKKKKKPDEIKVEEPLKAEEGTSHRVKNVKKIQIDNYLIEAWYFSPYPKQIATAPVVYICEFCLFYFPSDMQFIDHKNSCRLRHPPGNEIYRKDGLSFFEIDGHVQKNYCRNLCLLSKLFLDHKTLYYDIDPFMFYILCREEEDGYHLVGYFSKEKECLQGYNVACLLTMPHCQRKGYGRILIDFSYLLSRKEEMPASPEKPLSDLGLLTYRKYWKEIITAYLTKHKESSVSVSDISMSTGIKVDDIMAMASELGCLKFYDGEPCFVLQEWVIDEKVGVDEKCLEWEPVVRNNKVKK